MKQTHTILIGAALLVILTFAAYQPVYHGGFIWDDDMHVSDNLLLRDAAGLHKIWFELGSFPQYYPVTLTSFWINYQLWGLDTTGYHILNIILHCLNALLLWLILSRLSVPGAWAVALVFALHPVHVETAAWISERKNTLSGFFYLASFAAYIRASGLDGLKLPKGRGLWMMYGLSLALFVLALLSKTVTATLPAAILLVVWWKRGHIARRDITMTTPFFIVGIASGLLSVYMEKHYVGAIGDKWDYTFIERTLVAGRALWFYATKDIAPFGLIFNYRRWNIDAGAWWQHLYPLAALGIIAALWFFRKRIGRGPLAAVLFFCGTLLPALGFFDVYPFQYSFVADHFQYLASIGIITLAVSGAAVVLARYTNGMQAPLVMIGITAAVLWTLTWRQTHSYRDIETLWRDTIAANPSSWMAHNNLGILLAHDGRVAEAIEIFNASLKIRSDHFKTYFNLGDALEKQGNLTEAVKMYRESIRYQPDDVSSWLNLGNALKRLKRFDEAEEAYKKTFDLKPGFTDGWYNLGLLEMEQNRDEEALANFKKAIELNPNFAEAYNNMGTVLFRMGRFVESADSFAKALAINPNHVNANYNLAYFYSRQGKLDEAVRHYRAALRVNPQFASAHYNLGLVLELQGKTEESRRHLNEAARLRK